MSTSRLKEKLKNTYNNLIFHPSKSKNKSDLVYVDYIIPCTIIESAVISDDVSTTMDESSQDEGAHEEPYLLRNLSHRTIENKALYYSAIYLKNLLLNVDTNISCNSNNLTLKNALEILPTQLLSFLKVMLGFSKETSFTKQIPAS